MRTTLGKRSCTCLSNVAPSIPGILMSETITSKGAASSSARAASPPPAKTISHSRRIGRSMRRIPSRILGSSSTKMMRFMLTPPRRSTGIPPLAGG